MTLRVPSQHDTRHVVVLLAPFAEEMNKSRRLFTLQANTLCDAGFAVAVFDYYGTGDSEGAFGQANLGHWQRDGEDVLAFLANKGFTHCTPLAVRFGALMLDHFVSASPLTINHAILWQPVTSGAQSLNQFLRLQTAAHMMSGDQGPSVADMQATLKSGGSVEVAGYEVSAALFEDCQSRKLEQLTPALDRVDWFAIATSSDAEPPAAAARHTQRWSDAGMRARVRVVEGAQFWAATELVVVPELVARTTAAVTSGAHEASQS